MKKANSQLINGVFLLNKPQGITSNQALQTVKRLYHAKKAGHTGSLDPLATGMLPVCFGEATKFSQYLLDADKIYETTARLGVKTDTADSTGKVIAAINDFYVSEQDLKDILARFKGRIEQIPSMFSALKHQGQPLYKFARAGIDIERKAREVTIHRLELNAFNGQEFKLTVQCSKGTYIRNLVEDIGDALAVGAHVIQLHRVATAGFEDARMYSLDELAGRSLDDLYDCLLPVDCAIDYLPAISLCADDALSLRQGKFLHHLSYNLESQLVRLYTIDNEFIGLGEFDSNGSLKSQRLLAY